ncbi:quinoprotein amine dehydrogenase [Mesonia sp. K7]|uniref:quinoprotein amine dehydrogenase n=1 Tax=Mesonia sp. K7 TaxID=2218606 RepID=UPI0011B43123|nr:quinoprotein amine dehydrogenase [Mesonia sp. K7]
MKTTTVFLWAFVALLTLASCSSDDDFVGDDVPQGDYDNGIFILNEGQTVGSVSFLSNDFQTLEQEIFATVNPGEDIGNYLQNIFFDEENAYIIAGTNNITVVDRYSFAYKNVITTEVNAPRYGVAHNGKLYVTNQADFSTTADDYIAVYDVETLTFETKIIPDEIVEHIYEANDKIYVQNAAFGFGNKISVINPATNTIESTITTTGDLDSFSIDNDKIYALTTTQLEVYNLETAALEKTVVLDYFTGSPSNIDVEEGDIYFTIGASVYTMTTAASVQPNNPILTYETTSEFGVMYGFEVEDGHIFIADGGDFASNSKAYIYDLEGNLVTNINVGVAPNGFYFNE